MTVQQVHKDVSPYIGGTTGDLLVSNLVGSGQAVASVADIATGNALLSGGVGALPSWGKVTSAHVDSSVATIGGVDWTSRSAAEANVWRSVTYGNGVFVAVANSGTNRVMTSPDGINWTAQSASSANGWNSITYGNGLFVAVATDGLAMTSPDGETWTARSAAEGNLWFCVTYGNGMFVAVSKTGTNRVMTSSDGITWTARSASEASTWAGVTYGNGLFVAVADTGTNRVMTSPDGITWTSRSASEANKWTNVTYGSGLFVSVSTDGTNRVMTSPDGITWTARTPEASSWNSVTYGNGLFVAVAYAGTNRVTTSSDGITWTSQSASEASNWYGSAYGDGLLVAVATVGTNLVMTSGVKLEHTLYQNNSSGIGPVLRQTSPTLITPDLGTPSALVGTNITGTASGLTAGNADLLDGNEATAFATAAQGTSADTAFGWGDHGAVGYATGGGTASGTNTGDQTITLTGGVTGTGTGSFAATVVTNANLTGHVTSVGNAALLGSFSVAQLNTAINDGTIATGGGTATGTNTGDQTITLTGDVTGSGTGTFATTVGTLNQDTTGTAAVATTVTVADEAADTTCFPLFATAATGDLAPKSNAGLTFNSATGALGLGTAPAAPLHVLSTTEQLRLAYSATKIVKFEVDSAGGMTIYPFTAQDLTVNTSGQLRGPNGSVIAGNSPGIAFSSYTDTGLAANGTNLGIWESGTLALALSTSALEFRVPSNFSFAFSSATNNNSAADTSFNRVSAGIVGTAGLSVTSLTDGYLPRHVSDALGFDDSLIWSDGTDIGMGTASPSGFIEMAQSNSAALTEITIKNSAGAVGDSMGITFKSGLYDRSQITSTVVVGGGTYSGDLSLNTMTAYNGTMTPRIFIQGHNGQVGVNEISPDDKVHITVDSTDAVECLKLEQLDVSEGFCNFVSTSAANTTNPLTTWTTGNSIQGFVRVEINGTDRWMPFYDAPTS